MIRRFDLVFLFFAALLVTTGCEEIRNSQLAGQMSRFFQGTAEDPPDEQTVAAGLKDALLVGTERAVRSTSQPGGFGANELIRIALPKQLGSMARALRTVGMGDKLDDLEAAMNHAAEWAVSEAKPVFADEISRMTLSDALTILNGGETAATDYFRTRTENVLRERFRPIVSDKMKEVGLYRLYNQLVGSYSALPFVSKPSIDLDSYVTERGLDGFFTVLAQEEKNIRENPAARTTKLLRRVFDK